MDTRCTKCGQMFSHPDHRDKVSSNGWVTTFEGPVCVFQEAIRLNRATRRRLKICKGV